MFFRVAATGAVVFVDSFAVGGVAVYVVLVECFDGERQFVWEEGAA
ncbi:hypothetical protein AAEO50_01560 [Rossellomorea oryzaecorticis]|uniref:Uncharacterized protein n=1 Tax=Rossellomorea oryzaecorticis TaxID=1396505 RepID=A0ABU9K4N8_9BACI